MTDIEKYNAHRDVCYECGNVDKVIYASRRCAYGKQLVRAAELERKNIEKRRKSGKAKN